MAFLFEGLDPSESPDSSFVSENALNNMVNMDRLRHLAKLTVPKKRSGQQVSNVMKEAELNQRRQRLDEIYVGEKPSEVSAHETSRRNGLFEDEDPFESKMKEIENKRNRLGV